MSGMAVTGRQLILEKLQVMEEEMPHKKPARMVNNREV